MRPLDWPCMYILVDILVSNNLMIKFIVHLLVIVLNYLADKFMIFKKYRLLKSLISVFAI